MDHNAAGIKIDGGHLVPVRDVHRPLDLEIDTRVSVREPDPGCRLWCLGTGGSRAKEGDTDPAGTNNQGAEENSGTEILRHDSPPAGAEKSPTSCSRSAERQG